MSDLAQRQEAFLASILDENAPVPKGWGNSQAAGMAVYRGNYRGALMGAMAATYERTAMLLGAKDFAQCCINHAIAHPPSGWTIDEAGKGFEATCKTLFPERPEIAEFAWLEWTMMQIGRSADAQPISAQEFAEASAQFDDEDWAGLRLGFQPQANARLVDHDLEAIWRRLEGPDSEAGEVRLNHAQTCLVTREGERPTFTLLEHDHAACIALMQDGAQYADLIGALLHDHENPSAQEVQNAAMRAGGMLGQWLDEGLITAINP